MDFIVFQFFNMFIWETERGRERERKKETETKTNPLHLLIYSPDIHSSLGWTKLKLCLWNSIHTSHMSGRDPSTWVISACLTGYTSLESHRGEWSWALSLGHYSVGSEHLVPLAHKFKLYAILSNLLQSHIAFPSFCLTYLPFIHHPLFTAESSSQLSDPLS